MVGVSVPAAEKATRASKKMAADTCRGDGTGRFWITCCKCFRPCECASCRMTRYRDCQSMKVDDKCVSIMQREGSLKAVCCLVFLRVYIGLRHSVLAISRGAELRRGKTPLCSPAATSGLSKRSSHLPVRVAMIASCLFFALE